MEKYDVVLLGATFFSFGFAKSYKGKSLIIDAKTKPGYEYIDAFNRGENGVSSPLTAYGAKFEEYLKAAGLYDNIYIPEWTPFFSRWICDNGIDVLLLTDILDTEICDGGFVITLYNTNGKQKIFAKKIIDTKTYEYDKKSLSAVLYGKMPEGVMNVTYSGGDFTITEMSFPNDCDFNSARMAFYEEFEKISAEYPEIKVAAVADNFYLHSAKENRMTPDGIEHFASTFWGNPVLSFDKGCLKGESYNA